MQYIIHYCSQLTCKKSAKDMKVGVWFILLLAGQLVKYSISNYYFSFFSRNRVSFPPKNSAQISSERKGLKPIFANLFNGLEEEFRYRKSTIEQYRDRLTGKLLRSIEKFRRDQVWNIGDDVFYILCAS